MGSLRDMAKTSKDVLLKDSPSTKQTELSPLQASTFLRMLVRATSMGKCTWRINQSSSLCVCFISQYKGYNVLMQDITGLIPDTRFDWFALYIGKGDSWEEGTSKTYIEVKRDQPGFKYLKPLMAVIYSQTGYSEEFDLQKFLQTMELQ